MGSLCATEDTTQISRMPQESRLIVWGDIVNSETRVVMTLLSLARIRYELQQVGTPDVDYGGGPQSADLDKEDYLEVPE